MWSGKKVLLKDGSYSTDCYPLKTREQMIGLDDMNDAFLFNPRNCYQNYNVAWPGTQHNPNAPRLPNGTPKTPAGTVALIGDMRQMKLVFIFPEDIVEEPVTYNLISGYGVRVNILSASIDPGKQGRMVVELGGENFQFSQALNYLESVGVRVTPLAQKIRHLEDRCTGCTACVPHCPSQMNRQRFCGIIYYRLEAIASQRCGKIENLRFQVETIWAIE
ncbi:MAG: 4Fe-4S binding protein [Deltaproteobacteria bacterium]|nr:4Fe-4S binding protein [Deltaproteobacteria bacterium]